jgi:uncharacterized membrane protein
MARERRRGLDQPTEPRRRVPRPEYDPETFGRASERIARTFGTATYLMVQTVFVVVWITYNVVVVTQDKFDPYPFILLNLAFSTQAAYAAPLILLAQNRQADRDRVQYEQDRTRDERAAADTQFLAREVADIRIALGEVATRDFVRSELRDLLDDLLTQEREHPEPRRAP